MDNQLNTIEMKKMNEDVVKVEMSNTQDWKQHTTQRNWEGTIFTILKLLCEDVDNNKQNLLTLDHWKRTALLNKFTNKNELKTSSERYKVI